MQLMKVRLHGPDPKHIGKQHFRLDFDRAESQSKVTHVDLFLSNVRPYWGNETKVRNSDASCISRADVSPRPGGALAHASAPTSSKYAATVYNGIYPPPTRWLHVPVGRHITPRQHPVVERVSVLDQILHQSLGNLNLAGHDQFAALLVAFCCAMPDVDVGYEAHPDLVLRPRRCPPRLGLTGDIFDLCEQPRPVLAFNRHNVGKRRRILETAINLSARFLLRLKRQLAPFFRKKFCVRHVASSLRDTICLRIASSGEFVLLRSGRWLGKSTIRASADQEAVVTDGGRHLDLVGTNLLPVRCRFTVFDHMPFATLQIAYAECRRCANDGAIAAWQQANHQAFVFLVKDSLSNRHSGEVDATQCRLRKFRQIWRGVQASKTIRTADGRHRCPMVENPPRPWLVEVKSVVELSILRSRFPRLIDPVLQQPAAFVVAEDVSAK